MTTAFWILIGLVASIITRIISPPEISEDPIIPMVTGVLGAAIGGWVGSLAGFAPGTVALSFPSLGFAFAGAAVLLAGYLAIAERH